MSAKRRAPVLTVVALTGLDGTVEDVAPHSCTLRQAQLWVEELIDADRRKDEFLAMLGHELRNPLATIRNGIGLLQSEQEQTSAQRTAQALIDRQVRRMTRLVNDLLDVSRIRHGQLRLRRERMDLRAAVSAAVETLASEANQRRQQLNVVLPEEPVWLQADPERLEQVFVNLLANASRYTDAAGEIVISMHLQDGHAVVRIRDTGVGIAPEALPHVFELYRQADGADPRSRAGLGIGLALVRQLVELHGGSVSAASGGLGQGSEFTVRLPREVVAADDRSLS
ncbi:MAG TPA: HAMP domain-containing sensor histidine kinase [Steroidobacteraceae bacterium]|nr:HAMP domain-containing sensor histidine kinase [Steroidobacteraceae bacterium]